MPHLLKFSFLLCNLIRISYEWFLGLSFKQEQKQKKRECELCGQQMCGFCSTFNLELLCLCFLCEFHWITIAKYSHHCQINPNYIGLHICNTFHHATMHFACTFWWMCSVGCVWWHRCEYKVIRMRIVLVEELAREI